MGEAPLFSLWIMRVTIVFVTPVPCSLFPVPYRYLHRWHKLFPRHTCEFDAEAVALEYPLHPKLFPMKGVPMDEQPYGCRIVERPAA
jgi:hypothetical protein